MRTVKVVVAGVGSGDDADGAVLRVSRARSQAGDEVVHLGVVPDADVLARTAVAEDAHAVVVVGADETVAGAVRTALAGRGADDVVVRLSG